MSQTILLGLIILIVSPFLTLYLTTSLFYRRARSTAPRKSPPTVPYYVPGVFHAFSLATTGPQEYLAKLLKEYGEFAPFFVRAGPQPFLIIRDPVHIKQILATPEPDSPAVSHLELLDKLYGSPKKAVDKYAGKDVSETSKALMKRAYVDLAQEHLTGAPLIPLIETYTSILSDSMNEKMFQLGTWTQVEDSRSFLRQVLTRCITESLFGKDLFKQCPGFIKDYWTYAEGIEAFIPGLPRYWEPSAVSHVRDRLLQGIEEWLKANHSGSDFARIGDEDPVWDRLKGSKFVQERDETIAKADGMDLQTRAAEMLSIMHEVNSTLVSSAFWTLVEVLRRPQLAKGLTASIIWYGPSQDATYNVRDLTDLPLIDSLLAETTRLRSRSIVVRTMREDLELDGHWLAPTGIPAVLLSHDAASNTQAWAEARTRAVDRPLNEYWAERFLTPHRSTTKANQRGQRNDLGAMSFSMEGLETLNIGYGQRRLLGLDYIRAMHAATLAVLFNEFELQLCDPELLDQVLPPLRDLAYGTLKPLEQIEVRIRKRKLT
ncbi:putative cytochrome-like protein P450 [Setomelanomma holmii]|uniref:Cytochrome-like protein P450 n=1 Tax=Setomelanomma holmii TaxID=210430 RepID=A0A9P4H6R5_9PLEO|nr:putative cytochrome-like protein P450 [Setomelanomma holmii]